MNPVSLTPSENAVVTRVYDVRDLLVPVTDFDDAPDLRIATHPAGMVPPRSLFGSPKSLFGSQPPLRTPPTRASLAEDLTKLLTETVASDTWHETGGTIGTLRESSGCLVVMQTAANQRQVVGILEQLRETKSINVMVETHFLSVSNATVARVCVNAELPNPTTFPSTAPTYLDDRAVNALLRAAQTEQDYNVMRPARLCLFNGQRVYVTATSDREYVSNYKPAHSASSPQAPATQPATATQPAAVPATLPDFDPELRVATTGMLLEVSATVSADRKWVTLTLHPQLSVLQGLDSVPWPARPAGSNLTIQQPRINISDLKTTVSIPDKATLLLGGLEDPGLSVGPDQPHDPRRRLFILVKPTIILPRH